LFDAETILFKRQCPPQHYPRSLCKAAYSPFYAKVGKRKKQKADEVGDDDDTQQPYSNVICKLSRVWNSYVVDYIKLNASTLFDVFNRIYNDDGVKVFVERELKMVRPAEWKRRPATQQKELKPLNVDSFRSENDTIQCKVFGASWMETSSRKFAHEVKTNEYAVSVLLKRTSIPKKEKKKKRSQKQKGRGCKKRKTNGGNVVECSQVTVK
ncbi:hypothetical protein PHYBOEH_002510, partial [Phytophthora boehmeriae]